MDYLNKNKENVLGTQKYWGECSRQGLKSSVCLYDEGTNLRGRAGDVAERLNRRR